MPTIRRCMLLAVPIVVGGAAVAALAGSMDWAIVALNVAILAAFGWVLLWARGLEGEVARLRRSSSATSKDLRNAQRQTAADLAWVRRRLVDDGPIVTSLRELTERVIAEAQHTTEQMRRGFTRVDRNAQRASAAIQSLPATTVELGRRYQQLVQHDRLMPAADGGWALTARTLVWLLDHVAAGGVTRVLECGSGTSTIWLAAALEQRGEGHVFALESDPDYARQTRADLATIGLSHRAEVIDAPLVDVAVNGREPRPWYDLSGLPDDATDIDLLFVDGPVGALAPEVRYPAFPRLANRLAEHAVTVLDDTTRPDEANIVEVWLSEEHAGRRLERIGSTDRATIMRIAAADD